MTDGHIFLSYRSIEADFSLKLAADLKNAGVNLWMDRLDIKPAQDWNDALQSGINLCSGMIAALSPDYLTSDYCRDELARAKRLGKIIFPVLLRTLNDMKHDWPIQVERIQHVDFREWRDEKVYEQKLNELLAVLPAAQKGVVPDAETRYLTSLISDLESRKGVLEYVELSARANKLEEAPTRPNPHQFDEWAAGFSMLLEKPLPQSAFVEGERKGARQEKVTFNSITEVVEKTFALSLLANQAQAKPPLFVS